MTPTEESSSSSSSSSDDTEINDNNHRILTQFLEIVGDSDTPERAKKILESCGWSLENALAIYFAQHDEGNVNSSLPLPSALATEPLIPVVESIDLSASSDSLTNPTLQQITPIQQSSLASMSTTIGKYLRLIARSFMAFLRVLYASFLSPTLYVQAYGQLDFNSFFLSKFGSPKPKFFTGDFLQACQHAKRNRRILVIYLHSQAGSETICRQLFQNELFLDIAEESAVVWATISSRLEGQTLNRRILLCRELPHLSIFSPTSINTNEVLDTTSMSPFRAQPLEGFHRIGIVEGEITNLDHSLSLLANAIEFIENERIQSDRLLRRVEDDRRLREEQDRAYEAAVQKDLEIAAKAREKQQRAEQELLERQELEKAELLRQQHKEEARDKMRKEQLSKGRQFIKEELQRPWHSEDIRIRVRLPDGPRLERRFSPDVPLLYLFLWLDGIADMIESSEADPCSYIKTLNCGSASYATDGEGEVVLKALGQFTPEDAKPQIPLRYYLSTPFPVQKIEKPTAEDSTLKSLGFISDVALFLHFIDDDEV